LARAAGEGYGPGAVDGDLVALGEALGRAADEVAQALTCRPACPGPLVALLQHLHELRCEVAAFPTARRLQAVADARDGLERLRAVEDPKELLQHVAEEACCSCGFTRSVVARADAGDWVLAHACFKDDPAAAREYVEQCGRRRVPLEGAPLESEIMRRRAGVLLDAAAEPQSIVTSRMTPAPPGAHVVCPVVVGDRVIAFLYAGGGEHDVDDIARDALRWFADGVAQLYERAVLTARLRAQRDHVRQMVSSANTVMTELCESDIELRVRTSGEGAFASTASATFVAPERHLELLLTRRELEVLAVMAGGVSNAGVAEQLVIAEGTVKSHVKHILRKLRAANRAEAVARYLHQYHGDHG
jgi:DNA-binding CsgD family transcriptional regulator